MLPLLTPIGCDLDKPSFGDDARVDVDSSEANEDRRCADALVSLSLEPTSVIALPFRSV